MDPRAEDAPWSGSVTLEMLKALSWGAKDKATAAEVWIELLETVPAVPSLSKKVADNKSGGAVARRRQSRDINAKKRRLAFFERSPSQLRVSRAALTVRPGRGCWYRNFLTLRISKGWESNTSGHRGPNSGGGPISQRNLPRDTGKSLDSEHKLEHWQHWHAKFLFFFFFQLQMLQAKCRRTSAQAAP
jgi:hypothetical protein